MVFKLSFHANGNLYEWYLSSPGSTCLLYALVTKEGYAVLYVEYEEEWRREEQHLGKTQQIFIEWKGGQKKKIACVHVCIRAIIFS